MKDLSKEVVEAIGWTVAWACCALDDGLDPRQIEVPEVLDAARRDLASDGAGQEGVNSECV